MKRTIFTPLIYLIVFSTVIAQPNRGRSTFFEIQFGAGPTFIMSDIGSTGYGGNLEVSGKYRLHPHIALKASLGGGLGMGSGEDMEYYNILTEMTGQIEVYILKEGRGSGRGGHFGYKPRVRPYLYAGGGPMMFWPKHTHDNATELPDFSNYTVILVGGAGFLYRVNNDIFWGLQAGYRMTTTDYLEGYSPADAKGHDSYISAQVLLQYRF